MKNIYKSILLYYKLMLIMYLISPLVVLKVSNDIGQICELEGAQFVLLKNLNYIEMIQLWEAKGDNHDANEIGPGYCHTRAPS